MSFAMAVMNDDDQVPRKPCVLSRRCTLTIRRHVHIPATVASSLVSSLWHLLAFEGVQKTSIINLNVIFVAEA
jgi:hypothetical protein